MDLDALVRSQHGVCSTAQAMEAGLSEDAIRWRVASGRWSRIGQGLYRAQTGDLDWLGRAHGAVLRGRDGCALSLKAAQYLHGVATTAPSVITVAVPVGRSATRLTGTRFREHVGLEVVRRRGLPVSSAEQAVLDLADAPGVEWREAVATAARWVQKRRTTTGHPRRGTRRPGTAPAPADPDTGSRGGGGGRRERHGGVVRPTGRATARPAEGDHAGATTACGVTSSTRSGSSWWRSTAVWVTRASTSRRTEVVTGVRPEPGA
jgi:hypothetical protein